MHNIKKRKTCKECANCIHEYACQMWNIGTIHNMNSTHCINYETVQDFMKGFNKEQYMDINIKKLSSTAIMPTKAHYNDAGFDLYADLPNEKFFAWGNDKEVNGVKVMPHCSYMVQTNIAIEIPDGYFGAVYARSGLSTKQGLRPSNCVGVIDSGYRNGIGVCLHNDSNEVRMIEHGQRIAQLVIQPIPIVNLVEVNELSDSNRGLNGFGSSGK